MNQNLINYPEKLELCPIIEAIVEVRFDTDVKDLDIYSKIQKELGKNFTSIELPIRQIPELIRSQEINLKFSPLFKFNSNNLVVQTGSNSISIINQKPYQGWSLFFPFVEKILSAAFNIEDGYIKKVLRVGVRYVNFFKDQNQLSKCTKLELKNNEKGVEGIIFIQNEYIDNNLKHIVKFSNNSQYDAFSGSAIDIDLISTEEEINSINNLLSTIESSHIAVKKVFYDLVEPDFLKTLNPIYKPK